MISGKKSLKKKRRSKVLSLKQKYELERLKIMGWTVVIVVAILAFTTCVLLV